MSQPNYTYGGKGSDSWKYQKIKDISYVSQDSIDKG